MHDGMPYGRNQGQGHSREVDRQSPTGLIFLFHTKSTQRIKCIAVYEPYYSLRAQCLCLSERFFIVIVAGEEQICDVSGSESHSVEVIELSSDASASDTEPLPTAAQEQMPTEATGIETADDQILTATEGIIGACCSYIHANEGKGKGSRTVSRLHTKRLYSMETSL